MGGGSVKFSIVPPSPWDIKWNNVQQYWYMMEEIHVLCIDDYNELRIGNIIVRNKKWIL